MRKRKTPQTLVAVFFNSRYLRLLLWFMYVFQRLFIIGGTRSAQGMLFPLRLINAQVALCQFLQVVCHGRHAQHAIDVFSSATDKLPEEINGAANRN